MKMLLRGTLVCDDVAARYAAADAAVCVRVRMLLSDTLLRTLLYVRMLLQDIHCWCEDVAARYAAADAAV